MMLMEESGCEVGILYIVYLFVCLFVRFLSVILLIACFAELSGLVLYWIGKRICIRLY